MPMKTDQPCHPSAAPACAAVCPCLRRVSAGIVAMLLMLALTAVPADAQRAIIIVDGERVELDFDEVDALREHIQQQLRRAPGDLRDRAPGNLQNVNVDIPDDQELRRIEVSGELLALVADLNSESFETRETATAKLFDADIDHLQFYAVLARENLTTEQRSRLLMIVQQRLIHAPRGAVGISMRPAVHAPDGRTHVVVTDLIEGLPAERLLKVDDRITHLNGKVLQSPEQLTMQVQSHRPGDRIKLSVLRPQRDDRGMLIRENDEVLHEELEIELTLGSAKVLEQASGNQFAQNRTVERMRRNKAERVIRRFGPRHTAVEIDPESFTLNLEGAGTEGVRRIIADRAEQHPVIEEITRQRRILNEASMPIPNSLREDWRKTEAHLQKQLEQANLPEDQRRILEVVLERFRELTAD